MRVRDFLTVYVLMTLTALWLFAAKAYTHTLIG
jgi:hypothetical protein